MTEPHSPAAGASPRRARRIDEPMTMATDFLLAAVAATLSALLAARGEGAREIAWASAFALTAAAALVGGLFHGYRTRLGERRAEATWRATLLLSAGAGFLLLVAAALDAANPSVRRALLLVSVLKLAFACVGLWRTGAFAVVVYDAGASLLLILLLSCWEVATGAGAGAGWTAAGAMLALGGGLAQRRERRVGWFNHNDIFHFTQAGACYLLYRGALHP
jgi:hypothetical protein